MPDEAVRIEDAIVTFDGFTALDIDRFSVAEKDMRVVIGPNGAGKTTLCDVISGQTRLDRGRVLLGGKDVTRLEDVEIARRGVGRKFQTASVFGSLTVQENLALAARRGGNVRAVAGRLGIGDMIQVEARQLGHGQRQALEIGMLVAADATLMLVDEPAAGLSDAETMAMAALLRQLAVDHTLIVIEHDMDFVRELGARITVLNEGRILAEGSMADIQSDPRVVEAYLGR
jgi:urea transport system ATP-binding protein